MEKILRDGKFRDQLSGIAVDTINQSRIKDEILNLEIQDENFYKAVNELNIARKFISSPQSILGNNLTKHGEIAEQVEVGVRRARQALVGQKMTATFEDVGRCAPHDYIIDGINVQSKFINSTKRNLDAVLAHMEKYSTFGRDKSYYHIPKDEYEIIKTICNGEKYADGLRLRTIEAIRAKITLIENASGKPFEEVVKPGISTYAEVQTGKVHQTLNRHEESLLKKNDQIKEQITEEHQASLSEAMEATGIAAVIGATVSITGTLYKKWKDGKKFYSGDFSIEDWQEVGIDGMKGAAWGGFSGALIYGVTNYTASSAPFAAAFVSATKGVGSLVTDFRDGQIDIEEFVELGMVICAESAMVGFATVAGQAVIPIPVVGAVIGSIAGTILKNSINSGDITTAKMIRLEMEKYLQEMDEKYRILVEKIVSEFKKLGDLTEAAFSIENNLQVLGLSVDLARAYGIEDSKLLKSVNEIDSFMTG